MALKIAGLNPKEIQSNGGSKHPPTLNLAIKVTKIDVETGTLVGKRLDNGEEVSLVQRESKNAKRPTLSDKMRMEANVPAACKNEDGEKLGTQVGIGKGTVIIAERSYVDEEGVLSAGNILGLNQDDKVSQVLNNGNPVPVAFVLYKGGKTFDGESGKMKDSEISGRLTTVRGDLVDGVLSSGEKGSINDVIDVAVKAVTNELSTFGFAKSSFVNLVDADNGTVVRGTAVPTLSSENMIAKRKGKSIKSSDYLSTDEQISQFKENLTKRLEDETRIKREDFDSNALFEKVAIVVTSTKSMTANDLTKNSVGINNERLGFGLIVLEKKGQVHDSFKEAMAHERNSGSPVFRQALLIHDAVIKKGETQAGFIYSKPNYATPEFDSNVAVAMAVSSQFPDANREAIIEGMASMRERVKAASEAYRNGSSSVESPKADSPSAEQADEAPSHSDPVIDYDIPF